MPESKPQAVSVPPKEPSILERQSQAKSAQTKTAIGSLHDEVKLRVAQIARGGLEQLVDI